MNHYYNIHCYMNESDKNNTREKTNIEDYILYDPT